MAKSAILQTNALPLLATFAIVPGKASTLLAVTQAPTALIDLLPQDVEDQALVTAPQEIDQGTAVLTTIPMRIQTTTQAALTLLVTSRVLNHFLALAHLEETTTVIDSYHPQG